MTSRNRLSAAALIALTLTCAACVSPATTIGAYEGKAAQTASDAVSSARTAALAVDTYEDEHLTSPALEVILQESELALGSVTATFQSVEPPETPEADLIRVQLDALLADAGDSARELRIAARRQHDEVLRAEADSLAHTADELERFEQEHQS